MEYPYDPEPRKKKARNPMRGLYIGLILLSLCLIPLFTLTVDRSKRGETVGTIVAFDEKNHPIVEYEVDGKTYTFEPGSSHKGDQVGTTMTLLYKKDAPESAKGVPYYYSAAIIFAIPGAIVIVVWAIRRFLKSRKEMRGEENEIPQETESGIPQTVDAGTTQEIDRAKEYEMEREAERKLVEKVLGRPFRIFAWFFICFGALFSIISLFSIADNVKTGVGLTIAGVATTGLGIFFLWLIKRPFSSHK